MLRVAHLPRVGEWAAVGTAVMVAEDRALQSTGAILGRETGALGVHSQLTLPRRHGGFGLRHTNHLEGRAAYLSAAATSQRVMATGPAPFRPFESRKCVSQFCDDIFLEKWCIWRIHALVVALSHNQQN
jgi:hypothetical protein